MARRVTPDPERTHERAHERAFAPSGKVLRVPPQHVVIFLEDDTALAGSLASVLDGRGVTTSFARSMIDVVRGATDRPPSAVVTFDRGDTLPGGFLYTRLRDHDDERLRAVPLVVLHRGRASELPYYGEGVRLVRAPVTAPALGAIVCTVLAQRPHLVVRPPVDEAPPRPRARAPVRDDPKAYAGVLRAVRGALQGATARVAAQIERVGDRFEIRCAEPLGGREGALIVRVRWTTPRAERFLVDAEGELPRRLRDDRLTLLPQRGLRGALTSLLGLERVLGDRPLDDAFLIHAGDDALPLIGHARRSLLVLALHARAIEQHEDRLCVCLGEVPRHELARQVEHALELWRAALRIRASAGAPP